MRIPNWRDDGRCPLCPCKPVNVGEIYLERAASLCTGECIEVDRKREPDHDDSR